MATIHDITASRKAAAPRYYALYHDQCGIATRIAGGYTFRPETTKDTRLVSIADPALVLLGRCDLADASRAADEAAGGLAARICGTETGRRYGALSSVLLSIDRRMMMSNFTVNPMLTPHDDTVIAWQQACTQAAETLRPQHDRERLAKALALAHEGAVTLGDDGAALVTSHGTRYRIDADGLCHCPDMQNRGVACKHVLALQIHRQATAALTTSTPDATPLATARVAPLPSTDRWAVTEAPASCCVRLHIGEIELMYTMRDVNDAELTSRVQHLTPWVQDLVDQARERQCQLDTLRQQREAAAGNAAVPPLPPVPPVSPPTDVQALIQQAVQQALAAQVAASTDQPAAPSQTPNSTSPASPDGWCARHQVAMERRSNAKGTWLSHWLADENRWCRGK